MIKVRGFMEYGHDHPAVECICDGKDDWRGRYGLFSVDSSFSAIREFRFSLFRLGGFLTAMWEDQELIIDLWLHLQMIQDLG